MRARQSPKTRCGLSAIFGVLAGLAICCSVAAADETVQVCGSYSNQIFPAPTGDPTINVTIKCPTVSYNGGGFGFFPRGTPTKGQAGKAQVSAPPGLEIVGATASQELSNGVNDNTGLVVLC